LINQYTTESSSDILQLAYVLTPAGRRRAFNQLKSVEGLQPPPSKSFSLEMVDFDGQLTVHDIAEQTGEMDEEDAEGTVEVALDASASTETEVSDEKVSETFMLDVPAADWPSDYLAHRALAGLHRIAQQFGLNEDETDRLETVFHEFVGSSGSSSGVKMNHEGTRFLWLSAPIDHPKYAVLAEIARRLEPAICSEAPSERAIGQQRRPLAPHRTRTKPDLLSARTTMEDYKHFMGPAESVKAV
jgi:hypothetical protein